MSEELELLQSVIDAEDHPIFALDRDLRYTAFNRAHAAAMRELYGAEITLGGRLADYQPDADFRIARENLLRALAGERVVAGGFSGNGGRRRSFDVTHTPRIDGAGNVVGVVVRAFDVEELRESPSRALQTVIDTIPDAVYRVDRDYRLVFGNHGYAQMIAATRGGSIVIGESVLPSDYPPDMIAEWRGCYDRALTGESFVHDVRFPQGDRVLCFEGSFVPARSSGDAVVGVVVSIRNVTEKKRTEAALGGSEHSLEAVLGSLGHVIAVLDEGGTILRVNPSWRLLGVQNDLPEYWRREGANYLAACDAAAARGVEEAARFAAGIRAVLAGEADSFTEEYLCDTPDGERRFEGRVTPFSHAGTASVVVAHRDVTDRVVAAEELRRGADELRRSENRLRAAVDSMLDPHVLLEAVRDDVARIVDFVFADANAAACAFNGLPCEVLVGGGLLGQFPAAGVTELFRLFRVVVEGGEPLVLDNWAYPQDVLGGEVRIYDVRAVRVGDGVSVTWRDVSERHAAAADLAASEALYRSIFDASHDGIVLQQRDGRVLAWNAAAARILGVEPEEFIAAHSGALEWGGVREDGSPLPASEHPSRRTLATGDSCVEVVVGFRRGDEMRWVDVTTTPLFAEDEELPTAVVAVMADVTEQHRTRDELELRGAQLEATNKELEAFVYSVSHDLRQPLSAINAFSQLVVEDAGDRLGEDEREFLRRVRAATQRMAAMLDGLLKLSRASRLDLVSERVDVSTMTREILAELRAEQPERRVDCVVAPGLHVQADPALMRVVLVNLLDNALKFTSRHETARVEVGRTVFDGELAFFVRDDGDGFDPAGAGELFQPFHRLHRADEFPGTGIGLATVQRLVARYGGRIWAEGAVAKGATFYFTLPGPASTS